MSIRKLLASAAVGGGAITVLNRWLQATATDLQPPLNGTHHTEDWRGMDITSTEAGDPEDQTLLLLHGINAAGSSGEFRAVFDDLAEKYHVVAPDLPGFGCSDRPPLRYSATLYEEFVADFLAEYDDPAVVASSLSAAYTLDALTTTETTVSELLLICPAAIAGPEPPNQLLRELFRLPVVGTGLFNLVASKPSIRHFNADHGYYDMATVTEDWLDYEWQTAHQPNARFAPSSFISGYLNADIDLGETLSELAIPTTILWGRDAEITPLSQGRELAAEADVPLVVFDESKLLPHVEFPEDFVALLDEQFSDH
jgi:pimeloyl-ACP methyl ester carboxylesterase